MLRRLVYLVFCGVVIGNGCDSATKTAPSADGAKRTVDLAPGPDFQKRLQLALIQATPGTTIRLAAGTYEFTATLSLDVAGVSLVGAGMDKTILGFKQQKQGTGGEGLLVTQGDFLVQDLAVVDALGDAIKVRDSAGVTFRRVRTEWTAGPQTTNGGYGIYPVGCRNVLIEECFARGASDSGIYVGQSENVIVRRNEARENVAGIEIENTIGADVYENRVTNNTGGILVFTLPDLEKKVGRECRVHHNEVFANNHENFAPKGNIVATVPPGTGIMILANDRTEVFENTIRDHRSVNLAVMGYQVTGLPIKDPQFDPYPEGISIHDNKFSNGGTDPAGDFGLLKLLTGGKLPDVFFDGSANPAKLVDGKPAPESWLSFHNNGAATIALVNLAEVDLVNLDAATVTKLLFSGKNLVRRDVKEFAGDVPPVAPVTIAGAP